MKLVGGLYVRGFLEDVHQLRQIEEFRKARPCSVACAFGSKFNRSCCLTERTRPRVKVIQVLFVERVSLQIPHHGKHFCHTVAHRSTRREDYASVSSDFIQIAALHEHIG